MAGTIAQQLQALAQSFGMLHTRIGEIESGINRWALAIGGVGAVLAGSELLKGVKTLMTAGEEILNQQAKAKVIGLDQIQIQEEYAKAVEIGERVRGSLIHENIKLINSMYSIAGFEEAMALAPQMAQIDQIVQRFGGKAGGSYELIKAMELMGRISDPDTGKFDPKRASEMMDVFAQITEATGGKVTIEQFLAYGKQGGPMSGRLSDEGIRTLGSFIQDVGGYRAGTAMQALGRQFVGGIMTIPRAKALHELGILGDYEVQRGGHVVVGEGQMPIKEALLNDPIKMADMLAAAMKAHGFTTPAQIQEKTYEIFSTAPAQRMMFDLIRNSALIKGEVGRMAGAATTESAARVLGEESPAQVMANYTNAWKNLTEVVGMPAMKAAIPVINAISSAVEGMATFAAAHPEGMKLALEVLGGVGLGAIALGLGAIGIAIGPLVGVGGFLTLLASAIGAVAALNWDWVKRIFTGPPGSPLSAPAAPSTVSPGGFDTTPGGAATGGTHTGKHSYNAVPPPAGGGSDGGEGNVYLDGRKVGEIITGRQAQSMGGPLQGSAYFDGTWSSPASDLSLSNG